MAKVNLAKREQTPSIKSFPTKNETKVFWSISYSDDNNSRQNRQIQLPSMKEWSFTIDKDPFLVTYAEFLTFSIDVVKNLYNMVHQIFKYSLETKWREGYRHAIICNRDFAHLSREIEDVSNDLVQELSMKSNRVCYVFSSPDMIEESPWTPVGGDAPYPTLCLYLGDEDMSEEKIIENIEPIYADFDTGNPWYKIFCADVLHEDLKNFSNLEYGEASHLKKNIHIIGKI